LQFGYLIYANCFDALLLLGGLQFHDKGRAKQLKDASNLKLLVVQIGMDHGELLNKYMLIWQMRLKVKILKPSTFKISYLDTKIFLWSLSRRKKTRPNLIFIEFHKVYWSSSSKNDFITCDSSESTQSSTNKSPMTKE
jgi:hypothetical protein